MAYKQITVRTPAEVPADFIFSWEIRKYFKGTALSARVVAMANCRLLPSYRVHSDLRTDSRPRHVAVNLARVPKSFSPEQRKEIAIMRDSILATRAAESIRATAEETARVIQDVKSASIPDAESVVVATPAPNSAADRLLSSLERMVALQERTLSAVEGLAAVWK